jgi:hypothetical protein
MVVVLPCNTMSGSQTVGLLPSLTHWDLGTCGTNFSSSLARLVTKETFILKNNDSRTNRHILMI